MTVAFIVRENISVTEELQKRIEEVVTDLVISEWASTFIFTGVGAFDSACYDVVTKLKKLFPEIQRQYVSGDCEYNERDVAYVSKFYDKYFFPDKNEVMSYQLRDFAMIERCDVLVTYCNISYQLAAKWINCTATAMAYAWKKKKRIINLFENN